jgi:cytochrome oxidase assembly protein ShyY1
MTWFREFRATLGPFRPRLWPTVGTLVVVIGAMGLCAWQVQRDGQRNEHWEVSKNAWSLPRLVAVPDPSETAQNLFREVSLKGRFVSSVMLEGGHEAFGVAGYGVFQVFETAGGARVLVLRGSVRRAALEAVVQTMESDEGVTLRGQIRPLPSGPIQAPIEVEGLPPIWGRRNLSSIHAWTGLLMPGIFVIAGERLGESSRNTSGEIATAEYGPPERDNTSLHFAKQWFALALIFVLLWIWVSFESHQRRPDEA